MTDRIFLVGSRGSGKSTVGPLLAARLGWVFIDADAAIERIFGRTIATIFANEGEEEFRKREAWMLHVTTTYDKAVIATGGGVVLRPENRAKLKDNGFVAWLQASPETAWSRVQSDPTTTDRRPNLTASGGLEEMATLIAAREPLYREVADAAVSTDGRSPEEAVADILAAWQSSGERGA